MALVNPNIAMSYRAPEFQPQNQLAQYAQMQQILGGQQEQQLNALKMQEYERARTEQEGLSNYLAQADLTNPQTRIGALKYGKRGAEFGKALSEQEKDVAATAASKFELKAKQATFLDQAKRNLSSNPSDDNVRSWGQDAVINGIYTPEQAERTVQELLKIPPENRAQIFAMAGATSKELSPTFKEQNLGGNTQVLSISPYGEAKVVPGSVAPMTMTPFQTAELPIKQGHLEVAKGQLGVAKQRAGFEGQRVGLEGKRVGIEERRLAVAEDQAKKAADPAFQQRMSQARATGEAIAKGDVAAQQALPKIIGRAEEGLRLIDEMVGAKEVRNKEGRVTQQATKPHPGFGPAVGMGGVETLGIPGLAQIVPGTDAADFKTRFDQIKGASFLEAFESLKGGGAISEAEGTKATSAINRMSLAQSEPEFISAARDLQDVIRKGVKNAQTRTLRSGVVAPTGATSDPLGIR